MPTPPPPPCWGCPCLMSYMMDIRWYPGGKSPRSLLTYDASCSLSAAIVSLFIDRLASNYCSLVKISYRHLRHSEPTNIGQRDWWLANSCALDADVHDTGSGSESRARICKRLKGQCHEIFCFWFFSWTSFPQASDYTIRVVSNFFENSRRSSRFATGVNDTGGKWKKPSSRKILIILFGHLWVVELTHIYIFAFKFTLRWLQPDIVASICHRCQRHRWQICRRCHWYRWQFATGVVDTGGKFAAGIVDTGGKFAASINNASENGGKICHRRRWYRWQICHRCR